jgi:hypothetical protein
VSASPWPQRLFEDGPKRVLAIDGGGVRGAVAIAFLQKLEATLRERYGRPDLVLSDYFDLIGGTSVGAILAAGLALGASADQAAETFRTMGPKLFRRGAPRLLLFQARFDPQRLAQLLRLEFGDATLGSAAWKTGFAAIAKRVDTGSTWVLTNNPRAKYWGGGPDANDKTVPNRDYPLAKVVQASAAAPFYFDMVPIEVVRGEPGVFFDGAMTPHGNPALQMAMTALIPAYGFGWSPGQDQLLIVSIGTGAPRPRKPHWVGRRVMSIWKALHALVSVAYDNTELSVSTLQWLGHTPQPWRINSEVGDLSDAMPKGREPLWTFLRYDSPLESQWLKTNLDLEFPAARMSLLERLDDERQIPTLFAIGQAAADKQIRTAHFAQAFAPTDRKPLGMPLGMPM